MNPEHNNIKVFNNGKCQALKTSILFGGHWQPIHIVGDKLKWKKDQKNAKKNIISETMNKTIPIRKPNCTFVVWWPSKVDSVTISPNQKDIKINNERIEINKRNNPYWKGWNHFTKPNVNLKADKAVNKGQGLGSTKWKGCFSFLTIFLFFNKISINIYKKLKKKL